MVFYSGKQHGSLSRAGKVKAQTPKVDKKPDAVKPPRGRAYKRLLFNRRFVINPLPAGSKVKRNKPKAVCVAIFSLLISQSQFQVAAK